MVNPGGKQTMLGHWRIVLRQAEESARAGRFDEALGLAARPEVADHRQAVQLRARWVRDLVARAGRRAEAQDLDGALADLDLAEAHGAAPDALAAARLALADRFAEEVRLDLEAGAPGRVVERLEALATHRVAGPTLRRLREAAEAWRSALDEGRRGEFGLASEALDRAARLAGTPAADPLAAARRDLEARQEAAHPRAERLYAALAASDWAEVLAAAEGLLEVVPDHPAARQARARAWQQIGGLSPGATLPPRGGRVAAEAGPEPVAGVPVPPGSPRPRVAPDIVFLSVHDRAAERPRPVAPPPPPPAPAPRPIAARPEGLRCRRCGTPMRNQRTRNGVFLRCPNPRCLLDPARPQDRPPAGRDPEATEPLTAPRPAGRPAADSGRPPARGDNPGLSGRFLLWADAVGGYLVCLDDQVTLGRAGPDGYADVPLLGDLSRHHATIVRDGDGYLLRAHHPATVNGKPVEVALLRDGDLLRLGTSVELVFRQPSPVSATARLELRGRQRLPLAVDGVILMGETCIVGPTAQAHVPAPNLDGPLVLYRQGPALWCRAPGAFEVDGRPCAARAPVSLRSSVAGEGFSFSLEPLESRSSPV